MKNLTLLATLALVGCATDDETGTAAQQGTGANLTVDYFGDTDVVGFNFTVERVACASGDAFKPYSETFNVDLVDGIFPGMIELVEQTYSAETRHLGADLFITLEPGCYDVTAAPAAGFGVEGIEGDGFTPSADCSVASTAGAEVSDGQTTDVVLISQCVGDENGALDTLVTLNHPPVISLDIDEKFNYECEPVTVCATIYDVDDDPIETEWARTAGVAEFSLTEGDIEVIGFEDGHRVWQQCTEIVTRFTDTYEFEVSAFDLGYDSGSLVRIEDLVSPELSRDEFSFPIYTNWVEDPLCFDTDGTLVDAPGVSIDRAPGCSFTTAEQFYCNAGNTYGVDRDIRDHLCDGTTLIEENLYPECGDGC